MGLGCGEITDAPRDLRGGASQRPHHGSRTRVEARVAFPGLGEEPEEFATPTRKFTVLEITGGLPDDSRKEDEKDVERRIRDLQGRVKQARAAVATTSGLAGTLASD